MHSNKMKRQKNIFFKQTEWKERNRYKTLTGRTCETVCTAALSKNLSIAPKSGEDLNPKKTK